MPREKAKPTWRAEGPDSDDELAGDAVQVARVDTAERGAMGVALAELSRALDSEDWSVAVTVCESSLAKWPRWRELRAANDRLAGYLAACASATSARRRPPPPDIESLRLTDVDEQSLPSARAERTAEHLSRMGDVLPRVFGCLAREPAPEPLWTATPLLDKLIETSLRDIDDESLRFGPRVEYPDPKKCRERLVLYQTVRSVSNSFCQPLYGNIRRLCIDVAWCAHIPPETGDQFVQLDSVTLFGTHDEKTEAQYEEDSRFELPTFLRHLPKLQLLELYKIGIQEFPSWFAALPLKELYVEFACPAEDYGGEFLNRNLLDSAWVGDVSCLPRSLELMAFGECPLGLDIEGLECVRQLPCLQELRINGCLDGACPEWLHEIASLRRVQAKYLPLAESADVLRECNLDAIEYTMESGDGPIETDGFVLGLERLVVGTPCGNSLRELNIRGNQLGSVPDCLRSLQLQVLCVSETGITALPSWISELPLIFLDLSTNPLLATLPASLHSLTTLRALDVRETNLGGPQIDFSVDAETDATEPTLWIGGDQGPYDGGGPQNIGDCFEEVVRRDSILGPLSRALPALRLMLHEIPCEMREGHDSYKDSGLVKNWWHERCGYDWIDPIFYTCDGCRLTSTDGLEAARSAIRMARRARLA